MAKYASTCVRQARRVRPRRATSGIGQVGKLAITFSASSRRSRRLAVPTQAGGARVDRAQLLAAGPGELDLAVRVATCQAGGEAGVLAFGQVLQALPEPANPVERVVEVTTAVQLFLLDAAADLVDDLGAELDDVEGVQDLHGVGQRVAPGVGVAAEPVWSPRRGVHP